MPLQYYSEFKEALEKYRVSERALKAIENLRLVLLLAPTSAGKNTVIRHQLQTGRYYFVVSDTTRQPRINDGVMEKNGREYWFRSEEEMLEDIRKGEFLEAEIIHQQQVSGMSIRELEKAKGQHKIAITDVDIHGIHNVMRIKPDALAVMLIPPNFEEWQRRMAARGVMTPEEKTRRFQTAKRIFEDGLTQDYYHFVISENVEQSGAIIDAIVAGKPNPHQGRGGSMIQQLQSALQGQLSSNTAIL
jgi:guanylate kinase